MTSITSWLRFVLSLIGMVGFLWLVCATADHVWPEAKWYFVALFVGLWLFVFARQFVGGVNQYREATDAFVHHRIATAELPPDFRSLSHNKTLQEVIDEFGPPSRRFELRAPGRSGRRATKFVAYEYELPYEAAIVVMPQPPGDPNSKIQAVHYRHRVDDDEFFSPVRA
jgi:hypothetical protein